nr:MAG TPA: hypothetical protein [Caudoviricetes sp.]
MTFHTGGQKQSKKQKKQKQKQQNKERNQRKRQSKQQERNERKQEKQRQKQEQKQKQQHEKQRIKQNKKVKKQKPIDRGDNYTILMNIINGFLEDFYDSFVGIFRGAAEIYSELINLKTMFNPEKVNNDNNFIPRPIIVDFLPPSDFEIIIDDEQIDVDNFDFLIDKILLLYGKYRY